VALATPDLSADDRSRLEVVRAKVRSKAASGPAPSAPPPAESPAGSLLRLIDELYKDLQFEGAAVVLQLASHCEPVSNGEQAQLMLRQGLLKMESFDAAGARQSQLPRFVPPKTLHVLEEVRAALPAPEPPTVVKAPAPAPSGPVSLRPRVWIPAAGGAVLAIAGGALYLGAKANYDQLGRYDPSSVSAAQVHATADAGRALQTGAFVLLGAGGVALASAAALAFLGDANAVHASIQIGPGGNLGVTFTGVFP
jgi:hypothetical protein